MISALIEEILKYHEWMYIEQSVGEIAQCISYLKGGDKTINSYLEIGSLAGGTAYIFNKFFDIETTVLIDDNNREESKSRSSNLADIDYVEFIGSSQSKEAVEFVNNLDRTFDIVFIDGDHTYKGASSDVKNYSKFVSPGGYLIMHDTIAAPGVKKVFGGIRNSGNFASSVEFCGRQGTGVIKRND